MYVILVGNALNLLVQCLVRLQVVKDNLSAQYERHRSLDGRANRLQMSGLHLQGPVSQEVVGRDGGVPV